MKGFFLCPLFFLCFSLHAQTVKPFVMPSARAAGFGGIHAAQGDDFSALFSNPASFVGLARQWSAAELTISVYGPLFELLDSALNNSGNVENLVGSDNFAAGFDIGGPIALGLVDRGFGIGFFNRISADAVSRSGPLGAYLCPDVSAELFLVAGYSFRVLEEDRHLLDVGFLGKGLYRGLLVMTVPADEISRLGDDFTSSPYETHFGLGIDVGIKYTFSGTLTAALAGYDVFSPLGITRYDTLSDFGSGGKQSYARVQPRLALGLLYRVRNDFLDRYISDLILMADYRDFINLFEEDRRHPILDLTLGMEVTMLTVLRLRAGMADALPSGGFGIDMKILTFDAAVRGKELGKNPGSKRVIAFDLGFLFRY